MQQSTPGAARFEPDRGCSACRFRLARSTSACARCGRHFRRSEPDVRPETILYILLADLFTYRTAVFLREWVRSGDGFFAPFYFDRGDTLGLLIHQIPFFAALVLVVIRAFGGVLPSRAELGGRRYTTQLGLCLGMTLCLTLDVVVLAATVETIAGG